MPLSKNPKSKKDGKEKDGKETEELLIDSPELLYNQDIDDNLDVDSLDDTSEIDDDSEKASITDKTKKDEEEQVSEEEEEESFGPLSLFSVIRENLRNLGRKDFVHRIIYIGEHFFPPGDLGGITKHFRENIEMVNDNDHEERVTGFLLHYSKYFCHVLDGSEESLNEHLELLFSHEKMMKNLGRMKLLVIFHHIGKRFINNWIELTGKPPTLLEKIEPESNTSAKIFLCVQKLNKLGVNIRVASRCTMSDPLENPRLSDVSSTEVNKSFTKLIMASNINLYGKAVDTLPEYEVLQFLLESNDVRDLKDYYSCYENIPLVKTYHETTWPVAAENVPKDVYEKEYDLPKDFPASLESA